MKKSKSLVAILATVLALCVWGSAWAQDRAGTFSLSPLVGGCLFEGDQRLKTSPAYGFAFGYNYNEHLGAELGFSFIDSGTRHGDSQDVGTYFYHVDGVYHLTRWGNLQPYAALGIGGMTFDYERKGSDTAFAFNYGAGLEYFMTHNVALRGDVRHIITADGGFNDLLFTGGLTVFFGGKKAEAAPPPPPPPPVEEARPTPPPPPAPAPAPAPKRQEAVCIELKVLFDFDKDVVKPEYSDDIKRVADFLKANPAFKGTIEGDTDAVGSEEYNMGLSMRRAEAVKKYLVDNFGIDPARLNTVGFGKEKPVDTNLTSEGRQQNRRAVRVYCSSGENVPPPMKPQKCIILKVDFAEGSAVVDSRYNENFKEMADYMKEHPEYVGTIEGYADSAGSDKLNLELSKKRAEAVKKYLVENFGIPADRLNTRGIGKRRPIASNDTPEGRAENRYAVQVICEPS